MGLPRPGRWIDPGLPQSPRAPHSIKTHESRRFSAEATQRGDPVLGIAATTYDLTLPLPPLSTGPATWAVAGLYPAPLEPATNQRTARLVDGLVGVGCATCMVMENPLRSALKVGSHRRRRRRRRVLAAPGPGRRRGAGPRASHSGASEPGALRPLHDTPAARARARPRCPLHAHAHDRSARTHGLAVAWVQLEETIAGRRAPAAAPIQ